MSLIKYNTLFSNRSLNGFFDDFFNNSLTDFIGNDSMFSTPSVNIIESDANFTIEVAAPGLEKGDFELKVENDHLLISTKKENKQEETQEGKYTRREFSYVSFKRSFHLPETVDADAIKAAYENGILNVTLPKKEASKEQQPKVIEIS